MPASIHCKFFNIWQEKLFGLMSLPTKDQYEELKKRRLHMVRQVKICICMRASFKDLNRHIVIYYS